MITPKVQGIFERLHLESLNSQVNKKHACCIQDNKDLIICCNSNERSIFSAIYNKPMYGIHAEINCLYKYLKNHKLFYKNINFIRKKTKKLIIYVIKSNYGNSKPCQHCINTLKYYGIKKLYYTDDKCTIIKDNINTISTDHISEGNLNNIYNYYN